MVFFTQLAELDEGLEVLAPSATCFGVGGLVEGIAGYGHDIEVMGVVLEPCFCDFAAVCDDGDGFHGKVFFAVSELREDVCQYGIELCRVGKEMSCGGTTC